MVIFKQFVGKAVVVAEAGFFDQYQADVSGRGMSLDHIGGDGVQQVDV